MENILGFVVLPIVATCWIIVQKTATCETLNNCTKNYVFKQSLNKTQTLINNIIISSDNKGIEEINENPTPKKEFLNTMDLLCDNWIFIGKYL